MKNTIVQPARILFVILFAALLTLSLGFGPVKSVKAQDPAPTIYYVLPGGTGDCTSWVSACDLQAALISATSGSEIWAAAGVYKPTTDPADRAATFQLKASVAVYGGFAGTETSRDQRVWATNVTILSGDLNGDDAGFTNNGENSYHVVTGATGATLDGVTISAGNANGTGNQNAGGGMYNYNSNPALANVTFNGNTVSTFGGGMYNYHSSPALTNITFSGNSANSGGGMQNNGSSSPALTNVTFSGNSASWSCGGLYNNQGSNPALTGIIFISNTASVYGGGMCNFNNSNPALTNVTFSANSAANSGGGMYNSHSSPTLTNVTFSGNSAPSGGGTFNTYSSSLVVQNTILWGDTNGELVNSSGTTPSSATITSSVVQGGCPEGANCTNIITTDPRLGEQGDYGGFTQTVPLLPGSSAIDTGDGAVCPVTDQRAIARVGTCDIGAFEYNFTGIYYVTPGGSGTQDGQSWANASALQYSLKTARSGDQIWAAAGVYKPTADATNRTATFQLKAGLAVYGGFAGIEPKDFDLTKRDLATSLTILSGDLNGDDAGFTNNGENSYHVVTGADGGTLDGVTISAGNANGPAEDGTQNKGGGMYNDSASPTLSNITFSGNAARYSGGGMYNTSSSPALTNITFSSNIAFNGGGGLFNFNSNPSLSNVTFSGNSASYQGGGMINAFSSNPTLTNVIFSANSASDATSQGGGMYNSSSIPTLTDVTFSGNSAGKGGGMSNNRASPTLTKVTFSDNVASGMGGGMANDYSSPTLTNVTFSVNSVSDKAYGRGGGMYNSSSSPTLTNVTFSSNSAINGGGIYNIQSSALVIQNAILWGDQGGEVVNSSSSVTITSSVVQSDCPVGAACTNLITADPRLGMLDDYGGATPTILLLSGSSAIDAGNDSLCPAADQRGVTRPQGAHCDIGAFEAAPLVNTLSILKDVTEGELAEPSYVGQEILTVSYAQYVQAGATCTVDFGDGSGTLNGQMNHMWGWFCQGPFHAYTTSGEYSITVIVTNPDGLAGIIIAQHVVVAAPAEPVLTYINPSAAAAGSGDLALTVTGSGFMTTSVVRWNGADLATTYVSPTELSALIPAANLASVQTAQITVFTPPPGGGTSNVLAFFVTEASAGVTSQDVASGEDKTASAGLATATATGDGLLVVAEYDANPGGIPSFSASGTYFDVYAAPGNTFSQVEIAACSLSVNDKLFWWDAAAQKWQKASPQRYDMSTSCVTLIVTDTSSPSLSQLQRTFFAVGVEPNTTPTANPGGPYLAAINTAFTFDGSGSSDAEGDPLTYAWDFGDGFTSSDMMPTHVYTTAGVYTACLTVNDGLEDSEQVCTLAVVYDPSTGFVTGSGWIDSPTGAYMADPSLSGKATFGFVSKYKKGATVPEGNTEFLFQAGSFNFRSTSYDWLVVSKEKVNAQFKGSGTVNGALDPNGNAYKFMLWAGDGTPDTFRIRIWWESANGVEHGVYDNGFNQAIGGGSIVVHTGK